MKRVKIMLMSLTLLAVVGGALAFKAKYNETLMCYITTTNFAGTCPFSLQLTPADAQTDNPTTYYTTDIDGFQHPCFIGVDDETGKPCNASTSLTIED